MNIFWETFTGFYPTQYHSVKTDTGWSNPDSIGNGNVTQVKIDRNGIIHMIYYYIADVGSPDIYYRKYENKEENNYHLLWIMTKILSKNSIHDTTKWPGIELSVSPTVMII